MERGYIKLYRKINHTWSWSDEPITLAVFVHLLCDANFEEREYHGTKIECGQLIIGQEEYSRKCGITRMQLRTALNHLVSANTIKIKSATKKGTLISVVNYANYQCLSTIDNQNITKYQPNDNHSVYIKNENIKNNNKYIVEQANEQSKKVELDNQIDEIINYLNAKTSKDFRLKNKNTRKLISGRMSEGYKLDDFKKVIDNKCLEWENTDLEKFLRPDTLFRPSHFESYLNQKNTTQKPKTNAFNNYDQRDYSQDDDEEFMKRKAEQLRKKAGMVNG